MLVHNMLYLYQQTSPCVHTVNHSEIPILLKLNHHGFSQETWSKDCEGAVQNPRQQYLWQRNDVQTQPQKVIPKIIISPTVF